jgi:hypothetical protein
MLGTAHAQIAHDARSRVRGEAQPFAANRVEMRVVDIDKRHTVARLGEHTAEQRTHCARAENRNIQCLKHRSPPAQNG